MSLYDYQVSKVISQNDFPFYALVMAAMRQADNENLAKLQFGFPHVWAELERRHNAIGGLLGTEVPA